MDIAKKIDHTMLKADASADTIKRYCKEAVEHKFASVCVNSCHVPLVSSQLKGSGVMTCCVVGFPLGAMLTSCLLTDEEKVKACELSEEAGAAFVKTSTGFSTGGATVEDIRLMRKTVGDRLQVKASGGIRTPEFARELVEAGADRIGAGNGIVLL